jgi:hypothetical protein
MTRRHFWAEVKIRIVLEGQHGEESIAELWRREGPSRLHEAHPTSGSGRLEHFPLILHGILRRRDSLRILAG